MHKKRCYHTLSPLHIHAEAVMHWLPDISNKIRQRQRMWWDDKGSTRLRIEWTWYEVLKLAGNELVQIWLCYELEDLHVLCLSPRVCYLQSSQLHHLT